MCSNAASSIWYWKRVSLLSGTGPSGATPSNGKMCASPVAADDEVDEAAADAAVDDGAAPGARDDGGVVWPLLNKPEKSSSDPTSVRQTGHTVARFYLATC